MLRIVTWKVDGFVTPDKRAAVASYLWRMEVGFCVITGSNLRGSDMESIDLDLNKILHWRNKAGEVARGRGGVLIISK